MNCNYKYYKHRAIFWFLRIGYKSESSKIEVAQLIQKDTMYRLIDYNTTKDINRKVQNTYTNDLKITYNSVKSDIFVK